MCDKNLLFRILEKSECDVEDDRCKSCQPVGESLTGLRTHGMIPTDTYRVACLDTSNAPFAMLTPNWQEARYITICSDCLVAAEKSGVTIERAGVSDWKNGMFFHR